MTSVERTSGTRRPAGRALAWVGLAALLLISSPAPASTRAGDSSKREDAPLAGTGACAGPNEQVPKKYRGRYDRWKAVFLSADIGRQLWFRYACNPAFRLTIIVSDRLGSGGKIDIDEYRWVEGKLAAATIVLGHRLDKGYPEQVYYPVLGSLASMAIWWDIGSPNDVLAAAKIAHEFGHVDQAAKADPARFRLQNELSNVYAARFISNGHDIDDPTLIELADQMGGMPTVLKAQREYWAETYALRYLLDKLRPGKQRTLLKLVRKSLASKSSIYYLPSRTEWKTLASFE